MTNTDTELPWLTEEGLKTLQRGYMMPGETPIKLYERVSTAAAARLKKPSLAPLFFEAMVKNWLCCASPVLSNMGTKRGNPISCFGLRVPDSVDGIFMANHEIAMLTKMGGGIGVNLNHIRGRGTPIKDNGVSEGIMQWAKIYDTTFYSMNQGQTRRGAGSFNINIEHADFDEYIRMRRPLGDVDRQCLHTNHCVQISDAFMQSLVDETSPENMRRWEALMLARFETGEPYIMFQDTVNHANPDAYKKNGLEVDMTNICSEISLYSDEEHTFVCCLSSLNLSRWDEWKEYTFANHMTLPELATWFLDGVMQEFIENARHIRGFEKAVRFAEKSRALGLGVLGWHTLLQQKGLPFDTSVEVMGLNAQIFSFMQKMTRKASVELSFEYGEPEWCKGTSMRNTHTMALAPTFSNSIISGDLSPTIEPMVANAYTQKTAKGTFIRRNPILTRRLEVLGRNTQDVWKSIVAEDGSVQHFDWMGEQDKLVFLTARETNQYHLVRQAAQRQVYIDQSQSLNLYFPKDVPEDWFHQIHIDAWREGVKTLYYTRAESVLKGDVASRFYDPECIACEG